MNKVKAHRKLNKKTSHRMSMLLNMSIDLCKSFRIKTTLAKAKELRPFAEKLITKAIKISSEQDNVVKISKTRNLLSELKNNELGLKNILDATLKIQKSEGGYLRIIKGYYRNGDSADVAFIEFANLLQTEK